MKLTILLAQFLYTHKQLDLPGLGTFMLDPSVLIDQESTRKGKFPVLEGVSFVNNTAVKESPELIQFISTQSGKIKALASADLGSHLGLAMQFINIGKPFLFEGIGTLSKLSSGKLEFVPGNILTDKFNEQPGKTEAASNKIEEPATDYKTVFYAPKPKIKWSKPIAILLVLVSIGLAIWGGYTVYKKTAAEEKNLISVEDIPPAKTTEPLTIVTEPEDSILVPENKLPEGFIKYVLEITDQQKAVVRYNMLKTYDWNVQLETKDSINYKIFMLLPSTFADTTRIKDSLSTLSGKRVYIENK